MGLGASEPEGEKRCYSLGVPRGTEALECISTEKINK